MSQQAPILRLRETGENLPASLRSEVLALGYGAINPLILLLQDESAGFADAPAGDWPPIKSVDQPVELEAERAILAMLEHLTTTTIDEIIFRRIVV